jgi:hypothetical protein
MSQDKLAKDQLAMTRASTHTRASPGPMASQTPVGLPGFLFFSSVMTVTDSRIRPAQPELLDRTNSPIRRMKKSSC